MCVSTVQSEEPTTPTKKERKETSLFKPSDGDVLYKPIKATWIPLSCVTLPCDVQSIPSIYVEMRCMRMMVGGRRVFSIGSCRFRNFFVCLFVSLGLEFLKSINHQRERGIVIVSLVKHSSKELPKE